MLALLFATGNTEKFEIARAVCGPLGVTLEQAKLDIDEIQGEDSEAIIRNKAQKAFDLLKRPVIVSDDSWNIPALRGFPGPYMKSIDHWFTAQDLLNLTRPLPDRRVILTQLLAFQNEQEQKVFRKKYEGRLLTEARGDYGRPFQKVLAMPGDDGLSVAEAYDRGAVRADRDIAVGWQEFIAWYTENKRSTFNE